MKLFDIVPAHFFSILASANREIYFDALMVLHDMFKFELNIRVDDYLASLVTVIEDRDFELEADDEQESGLTVSGKARLILNRFIKTGWIDKEFIDGTFIEIITPRSYAIPVLKLLSELSDNGLHEYNSLVFATFSGLKQAVTENNTHLYEAVLSAKANTEQLQYALRGLYHSIRGFLRGIAPQQDVNELLQDHFNDYKTMSDRVYHPIKTMDSVHRYMVPIQSLLADILADAGHLQSMRERAMNIKKHENEAQAEDEIIQAIDYVMAAYQAVGHLVNEIDRKHSNYTKSSIEKIQYLMTTDQTIKGKLTELIKAYTGMSADKQERLAAIMEDNIQANRQAFLDERSLYHKNVRHRRVTREPLVIEQTDSLAGLAESYLVGQINNRYNNKRIHAFVEGLFADGQQAVAANEITIADDSDFIMLILAVIRQGERGLPHAVTLKGGRVERNGYFIPNMVIHRKGGQPHVE